MNIKTYLFSVIYTFLGTFCVCDAKANFTYIPPIKDGYEAAIVFIPEFNISGSAYRPLAELLQKQSPLSLWCVLFEAFDVGVSPDDELSRVFPNVTVELKTKGMKNNVIFMAGHGTGGVIIASFLQNNYKYVNGTLLLGSKVPGDLDLLDYLVPTYSISGDMDGIVRITSMLHMYENSQLGGDYRTPFIVLPGVNHSQFASGEMPEYIKESDFPSTMNDSAATNLIAHVCNIVMITILRQPDSALAVANNETKKLLTESRVILQPLVETKKLDEDDKAVSEWSKQAQTALAGIKSDKQTKLQVNNTVVNKFKLYFNHPSINLLNGNLSTGTWSNINMPKVKKYDYDYYGPVSPVQIQTIMVAKATVKELLPNETFNEISMTCMDLN